MHISDRLKELIRTERTQKEFAQKTGIGQSTLSTILRRGSSPSGPILEAIAKTYPNFNLTWLLTGSGQMWLDAPSSEDSDAISGRQLTEQPDQTIDRLNELLEQRVKTLESEIRRLDPERAKELGIE